MLFLGGLLKFFADRFILGLQIDCIFCVFVLHLVLFEPCLRFSSFGV